MWDTIIAVLAVEVGWTKDIPTTAKVAVFFPYFCSNSPSYTLWNWTGQKTSNHYFSILQCVDLGRFSWRFYSAADFPPALSNGLYTASFFWSVLLTLWWPLLRGECNFQSIESEYRLYVQSSESGPPKLSPAMSVAPPLDPGGETHWLGGGVGGPNSDGGTNTLVLYVFYNPSTVELFIDHNNDFAWLKTHKWRVILGNLRAYELRKFVIFRRNCE